MEEKSIDWEEKSGMKLGCEAIQIQKKKGWRQPDRGGNLFYQEKKGGGEPLFWKAPGKKGNGQSKGKKAEHGKRKSACGER